MLLQQSTWKEVKAYLKESTGIIIPIGSTEQHGPNGLIGTDIICAEKIAHGVSEKYGVMVGPSLGIGMSQHHLAFAGSMTFRPSTLMAVVEDVVGSLARHGFTHIFFFNGHGGNVSTLNAAFSEIYAEYSMNRGTCDLHCTVNSWYEGKRVKAFTERTFPGIEGDHATPTEVSLSFHAYPHAVKTVEMEPEIAPAGDFRDAVDFRMNFPDGRIGSNPMAATVEAGKEILELGVEDAHEAYTEFLKNG